ncbi:GntR family transcriptional regulator, partial [Mesorhizobium sp. M0018]
MQDAKPNKGKTAAEAFAERTSGIRRADAARIPGSSVHASLANEIGLRIVRGDYPPGTILPNEAKWSETFDVSRS